MSADKPRVVSPNRNQLLLQPTDLEKCIPDDHPARGVWRFVDSLIERRTGKTPAEYLVDGGFVTHENIEVISRRGATVYAPTPKPKKDGVDRYAPKRGDSPTLAAWRIRMGTEDAKRVYVQRAVLAERTNADLRGHRGLDRLNIRGLAKVKSVVLLAALSFNVLRLLAGGGLT